MLGQRSDGDGRGGLRDPIGSKDSSSHFDPFEK